MTIALAIVTLQIINISIDPVDAALGKEDLNINEIESCVEFIVEVVFNNPDAIEESDDQDETPFSPQGVYLTLFPSTSQLTIVDNNFKIQQPVNFFDREIFFESLVQAISSPPPKVA